MPCKILPRRKMLPTIQQKAGPNVHFRKLGNKEARRVFILWCHRICPPSRRRHCRRMTSSRDSPQSPTRSLTGLSHKKRFAQISALAFFLLSAFVLFCFLFFVFFVVFFFNWYYRGMNSFEEGMLDIKEMILAVRRSTRTELQSQTFRNGCERVYEIIHIGSTTGVLGSQCLAS